MTRTRLIQSSTGVSSSSSPCFSLDERCLWSQSRLRGGAMLSHRGYHVNNDVMMTTSSKVQRQQQQQQRGEIHRNFNQDEREYDDDDTLANPLIPAAGYTLHRGVAHPHYNDSQFSLRCLGNDVEEDHDDNMANPLIPAVSVHGHKSQYNNKNNRHDSDVSSFAATQSLSFQSSIHKHFQQQQQYQNDGFKPSELYYIHDDDHDVYSRSLDDHEDCNNRFDQKWRSWSAPTTPSTSSSPPNECFDDDVATVASSTTTTSSTTTSTASGSEFVFGCSRARAFQHKQPRKNRSASKGRAGTVTFKKNPRAVCKTHACSAKEEVAPILAKQYQQQQQQQHHSEAAGAFGMEGIEAFIVPDSPRRSVRLLLLTMEKLPQLITPEVDKDADTVAINTTTSTTTTTTTGSSCSSNNQTTTKTKTTTTSPIRLRALSVCSARESAKMMVRDHSDATISRSKQLKGHGYNTNTKAHVYDYYYNHIITNPRTTTALVYGPPRQQNHHSVSGKCLPLLPVLFSDGPQQEKEEGAKQQHDNHFVVEFNKHDLFHDKNYPSLQGNAGDGLLSMDMAILTKSAVGVCAVLHVRNHDDDVDSLTWSCSDSSSTVSSIKKQFEYKEKIENYSHDDDEEEKSPQLLGLSFCQL